MARGHVHGRSTVCPSVSGTIEACLVFITSLAHRVYQEGVYIDHFTRSHSTLEVLDYASCLTKSQHTDTGTTTTVAAKMLILCNWDD